jgi:hypothetical protein
MKKFLVLTFLFSLQCCLAQVAAKNYTSNEFGWTIKIPEGFTFLNGNQQDKLKDKGIDLVEKAYDVDNLEEQLLPTTILFAVKKGEANYMEANYQSFNPAVDGDYKENIEGVTDMLYQTFLRQMPKAKIDKDIITENINGKVFLQD